MLVCCGIKEDRVCSRRCAGRQSYSARVRMSWDVDDVMPVILYSRSVEVMM